MERWRELFGVAPTVTKRWFRVKVTLGGTAPVATCWCVGLFEERESEATIPGRVPSSIWFDDVFTDACTRAGSRRGATSRG